MAKTKKVKKVIKQKEHCVFLRGVDKDIYDAWLGIAGQVFAGSKKNYANVMLFQSAMSKEIEASKKKELPTIK